MLRKVAVVLFVFTATVAMACVDTASNEAILGKDLAKYKNVTFASDDCIVTLNGEVDRLSDRLAIERIVYKHGFVAGVVDHITVGGPFVDDRKLVAELTHKLRTDRGWNGNLMSFGVTVNRGEATVSGIAYSPMARDEALTLIASTRGIREIVDGIQISPVASQDPYRERGQEWPYSHDKAFRVNALPEYVNHW
jgi:osmotically-inducible protein OsmY